MAPRPHTLSTLPRRVVAVALLTLLSWPAAASADLYKYVTPEGDIIISTQRRGDLKLVEVIEAGTSSSNVGGGRETPAGRRERRAKKFKDHVESARAAKTKHLEHYGRKVVDEVSSLSHAQREIVYDDIIAEASEAYDVPFAFVKAVIRVESNFNPHAISDAGAQGLMQLMPRTAAGLHVTDPFDPRQNIFGGTKLLRVLIDRYDGDINRILAAYNAGNVAVDKYEGIPYPRTRGYVASVYRWYKIYSSREQTN